MRRKLRRKDTNGFREPPGESKMKPLAVLDALEVASPCQAAWDEMQGDDTVRHCKSCRLNVYNLSRMTRGQAENLVRQREGRLCVRFYRRADGTVLTRDCPIGLRAIRGRLVRVAASIGALVGAAIFGGLSARGGLAESEPHVTTRGPLQAFKEWLDPQEYVVAGELVAPMIQVAPPVGAPLAVPDAD